MLSGLLEYASEAIAYALLAVLAVEVLLAVWQVQDPPLDIAFRLLVLAVPPVAPLLFALLEPGRGSVDFRHATALLDLQNWLGPAPSLRHPVWAAMFAAMAATAVLEATAFLRWLQAGRTGRPRQLSGPAGRLHEVTRRMAARGIQLPPVRVVAQRGPVAYTVGLLRPTILISPALLELLDDEELEGVLAHEWAHSSRQDNWLSWLTFLLRVVSFYNPVVQFTYHRMGHDVEKVCDAEAGRLTGRSLALASALIKVYTATRGTVSDRQGLMRSLSTHAISLENRARRTLVEDRVERMVHPGTVRPTSYPGLRLVLAAAAVIGLSFFVV